MQQLEINLRDANQNTSKAETKAVSPGSSGLPKGWMLSTIGKLSTIVRGISFPKEVKIYEPRDGYIACLRTANVQQEVEWDDLWFVPKENVKRNEQIVLTNDILISTANSLELVGKVSLVKSIPHPSTLGAFISLLRVSTDINPKFIYFQLASTKVQAAIRATASTTTNISNISTSKLTEIEILIPPLAEQHRIVARIEEIFTQINAGVASLRRAQAGLKRYKAAVLKAACEGRLAPQDANDEPAAEMLRRLGREPLEGEGLGALPEGWCWASIGDLAIHITSGSRGWAQYYSMKGDLFIRVGNFNKLSVTLDLSNLAQVKAPETPEAKRTRLQTNDVLVTITADVGMVAIIDRGLFQLWKNVYINQHVGLIRLKNSDFAPYIAYSLASEPLQHQFKQKQYGATKKGLNLDDIKSIVIPLAPLAEQRRIIIEIERRLSLAQEVEKVVEVGLARAARLRQAVLRAAFEGRL
jgi:type I restriction enzyme S subunit